MGGRSALRRRFMISSRGGRQARTRSLGAQPCRRRRPASGGGSSPGRDACADSNGERPCEAARRQRALSSWARVDLRRDERLGEGHTEGGVSDRVRPLLSAPESRPEERAWSNDLGDVRGRVRGQPLVEQEVVQAVHLQSNDAHTIEQTVKGAGDRTIGEGT